MGEPLVCLWRFQMLFDSLVKVQGLPISSIMQEYSGWACALFHSPFAGIHLVQPTIKSLRQCQGCVDPKRWRLDECFPIASLGHAYAATFLRNQAFFREEII